MAALNSTEDLLDQQAEEIAKLEAKIERLRAALKPFAKAGRTLLDEPDETGVIAAGSVVVGDFRRAASAYEQSGDSNAS